MSIPGPESRNAAPLAQRVASGADAAEVAACFAVLWREVEAEMTPIIGTRGISALYARGLHVTAAHRPPLAALMTKAAPGDHLRDVLAWLDADSALAIGDAFLQTFRELLTTLIGPSLTERLLRDAWAAPSAEVSSSLSPKTPFP